MRALTLFTICVLNTCVFSQPFFQWAKNTHSVSGGMILDPLGNIVIAGTFTGTVDFDPGPGTYTLFALNSEAFVSKLDPAGNFLWACQLNSSSPVMNYHKTDISGNVYCTGAISGTSSFDSFIWKIGQSGNTIWIKKLVGSSSDNGIDIEVDVFGNVYTTGVFASPDFDFDPGPGTYTLAGTHDGYISKLDANGNFLWAKKIDNSSNVPYSCVPWNLIVDGANGVYFCGQFSGISDFDPGISSYTIAAVGSNHDGFVAKIDTAGNFLWAGSLPSLKDDASRRLLKSGNDIFVTGYMDSIGDIDLGPLTYTINSNSNGRNYILKINSSGAMQWHKEVDFNTQTIQIDQNKNLYFCGYDWFTIDFDPSPSVYTLTASSASYGYLCKLDSAGSFKWAVQLQDTGWVMMDNVALNNSGDIYVYGQFAGRVDFNPGPASFTMNATGYYEYFAMKLTNLAVGFKELSEEVNLIVYPNPVKDTLTIQTNAKGEYRAEIYNLSGQKLLDAIYPKSKTLDLRSFQAGIYILSLQFSGERYNYKIIKIE